VPRQPDNTDSRRQRDDAGDPQPFRRTFRDIADHARHRAGKQRIGGTLKRQRETQPEDDVRPAYCRPPWSPK